MTYSAKLVYGSMQLDLSGGGYSLGADFVPPPVNVSAMLAPGLSSNRLSGDTFVGRKASSRSWAFSVRCLSTTEPGVTALVRRLAAFLELAGEENNPLYFEFLPDADIPEPVWGQFGAALRYEVIHAAHSLDEIYSRGQIRKRTMVVRVNLTIKPFAVGKRQRHAMAKGGIFEDFIGSADRIPRGVMVSYGATNKFTNPVFGHDNWSEDWTAGSDLATALNVDPDYWLFAGASARVVNAGATNMVFSQSINVGNTNSHVMGCFIKLPDGSAPTSTDFQLYYDSAALSTSFASVGNGWYRAGSSAFSGVASAKACGIIVRNSKTCYVDAFNLYELSVARSFEYGDMLGCSWSGTAHKSTSVRAAGAMALAINNEVSPGVGTIRVVWKPSVSSATTSTRVLFEVATSAPAALLTGYFDGANNKFKLTDGTNTIESGAVTFAALDRIALHFVYGAGTMKIYRDGAEIATGNTYKPIKSHALMYIGCDSGSTNLCEGELLGLSTFDVAFTAAQALADYNRMAPLLAEQQRIEPIPFLWLKDLDSEFDNADSGSYQNWGVVGGVTGDLPADTYIRGSAPGAGTNDAVYLSVMDVDIPFFVDPAFLSYNASAPYNLSVSTTGTYLSITPLALDTRQTRLIAGRYLYPVIRGNEDGANNLLCKVLVESNLVNGEYSTPFQAVSFRATSTDQSIDIGPQVPIISRNPDIFSDGVLSQYFYGVDLSVFVKRASGAAADFNLYSFQFVPAPTARIKNVTYGAFPGVNFVVNGNQGYTIDATTAAGFPYSVQGDVIEFVPRRYNILITNVGDKTIYSTNAQVLLVVVWTAPRWSLL